MSADDVMEASAEACLSEPTSFKSTAGSVAETLWFDLAQRLFQQVLSGSSKVGRDKNSCVDFEHTGSSSQSSVTPETADKG